jgi:class 3 adenylate cyclase
MIDASEISTYNIEEKFSKSNNLIREVSKEFKDNGYECSEKEFPDKFLQKRELLSPISVADSYGLNWCTFAVIPASDHIASMLSEIIKFIAICLPILVGAGYLSARKAFKISDPIIQLKESVDSFSGELVTNSEANFSRASEPDAPHEIRELAEAFSRMSDNLRKNISNLRRSEQDLGVKTEDLILTKERLEHLNKTLSQFVPDEFFRLLNKDVNDIRLGDNKRTRLTILFSDIRSFTSISESLSPRDNFAEINRFLGEMEPEITNNNGFIDKFIGDAIMALFSAEDSALHAVEAGINMHRKIPLLNQERKANNPLAKDIEIGVGIHTGDLMIGIIGGNNRMETTVISQNVNLASRLEGLTKHFGAKLIISEVTLKDISPSDRRRFNLRYLGPVVPKGSTDPVRIHEVLDADEPEIMRRKLEYREKFERALRLGTERKFEEALNIFKEIFIDYPEDKAVHFWMERCERRVDFREELSVK